MLIALSSVATGGKDTFLTLFRAHLPDKVISRVAFADELKKELDPLFKAFGGTAFETDPVKKSAIRKVLVSHGMSQRILSNGRYWIDKVESSVKEKLEKNEIVVITDCRFENELQWVKSLGGKVVYIERIGVDGKVVPPVNEEEAANDPILRNNADILISWPTEKEIHSLWPYVEKATKELGLI